MKALTKSSSSEEIKAYFKAILSLAKASEKYPVNLDEVWMLVYENRADAVRALKRDFINGEDYSPIRSNAAPENQSFNPNPKIDYLLSVPCLEYFIARKVRPVFEVYRQVFHKKDIFFLYISHTTCIFVVRKLFIINDMGIFYAHKASYILKYIEKLYPCFIDHMSIKGFRRLGYDFSFLFIIK